MLNSSQAGDSRSRIMIPYYTKTYFNHPLTIKISPQHYLSTVKIELSFVKGPSDPNEYSESITIHEKLVLKQQ